VAPPGAGGLGNGGSGEAARVEAARTEPALRISVLSRKPLIYNMFSFDGGALSSRRT